jgi:ABC-2 type transport system ATP-binding protein
LQNGYPPVIAERVTKAFGDLQVLRGIDLAVDRGEIFGLVGPSGCGKTTFIRIVVGLSRPTAGHVRVRGTEPASFTARDRERIGYVPQEFFLYPTLTVWGNALYVGSLYGLGWRHRRRRAREMLRFMELWDARGRLTSRISGGMQRRLLLACALLHEPRLLVVDEPTAGLDPVLRQKIWGYLGALREQGVTVFLTTQMLDEAEHCDRVAVMNAGSIVAVGTPDELRREARSGETVRIQAARFDREDLAALWRIPGVARVHHVAEGEVLLVVDDASEAIVQVTRELDRRGRTVVAAHAHPPTFDEVFMELVAR